LNCGSWASPRDRRASRPLDARTPARAGEWAGYLLEDFDFAEFDRGTVVVDLGCGSGAELPELHRRGCVATGLDIAMSCLVDRHRSGLRVSQARAEHLPVRTAEVDGIVCRVVLPYTDEARVLAEIGRVLKPGGRARVCSHGAGYYLHYVLVAPSWRRLVYALRTLANTWMYVVTGQRLPGFLGDTIYQSRRRLRRYYHANGLALVQDRSARGFLGFPVFIYQTLQKTS
jgi:SAM-dependent methyltransferase